MTRTPKTFSTKQECEAYGLSLGFAGGFAHLNYQNLWVLIVPAQGSFWQINGDGTMTELDW